MFLSWPLFFFLFLFFFFFFWFFMTSVIDLLDNKFSFLFFSFPSSFLFLQVVIQKRMPKNEVDIFVIFMVCLHAFFFFCFFCVLFLFSFCFFFSFFFFSLFFCFFFFVFLFFRFLNARMCKLLHSKQIACVLIHCDFSL